MAKIIDFYGYNQYSAGMREITDAIKSQQGWGAYRKSRNQLAVGDYLLGGGRTKRLVVCWGNSGLNEAYAPYKQSIASAKNHFLNMWTHHMSNKKTFFHRLSDGPGSQYFVPWTTSSDTARDWITNGYKVVGRKKLDSHSGDGIVIMRNLGDLTPCHLYTRYVKKAQEYRVHINSLNDDVIVQQKRRKIGLEYSPEAFEVRNHQNGWVYCRENLDCPSCVVDAALSLKQNPNFDIDFCAVDIIYNEHAGLPYILEANTAPGVAGQTVQDYKELFMKFYDAKIAA